MGDVVLCSPVIRCLYRQVNCSIDVLTNKEYRELICHRYVRHIYEYQHHITTLYQSKYDYIIDLQNTIRSRRLSSKIRGQLLTSPKYPLNKWLFLTTGRLKYDGSSVVQHHFKAIAALGVNYDHQGVELPHPKSKNNENKPIAINLGGSTVTKRIPTKLAKSIMQKWPHCTFHLLGGDDSIHDIDSINADVNIVNHVGRSTLLQTIEIMARCQLVITGDTGLMHIAAALDLDMIVVWGATDPIFGFGPLYADDSQARVQHITPVGLSCHPCSRTGKQSCPKGHLKCLNDVDPSRWKWSGGSDR